MASEELIGGERGVERGERRARGMAERSADGLGLALGRGGGGAMPACFLPATALGSAVGYRVSTGLVA